MSQGKEGVITFQSVLFLSKLQAGEICFGGVLAACPGLTSVPDINSTGSCRCQTAAPEATGNTLNCRRKSGLIPRLVQPVSLGMAPYPVAFNQAYGRLYRTGDRGKWTAGQLEAS